MQHHANVQNDLPENFNVNDWVPEEEIAPILGLTIGSCGQAIRYGDLKGKISWMKPEGKTRPRYYKPDAVRVAASRMIPKKVFLATG